MQLIIYEMTNSLDALAQGNEDDYDEDDDDDDEDTTDTEDFEDGGGGGGDINGGVESNGMSSSEHKSSNGKMTDLSKLLDPAYSAYFEVRACLGGYSESRL